MDRYRLQQIFRLLLTTLALVAIALVSALITMRVAIHGAEIQIPDTRGLTAADAMQRISDAGLNATISDRYPSAEVPAGHIVSQAPDPGTTVRRDWIVRLTESLGPPHVSVPDLVGLDQRSAALAIRHAGLDVGAVALLPQPGVKPGTVIAQDPPAATQSADRTRISILLAADTAGPGYVMPDFRGQPFQDAAEAATGAGLILAPLEESLPTTAVAASRPRIVIGQRPVPGTRVAPGTVVQFAVGH
jgi:eukaryotic-like serine/threonine-protein kinase